MQIPGCASGKHLPEVTSVPTKPPVMASKAADKDETEVYKSLPAPLIHATIQKLEPVKKEVEDDLPDAPIAINTLCKRTGCSAKYVDESSRTERCDYHPGVPVFHEGSKGYSCCKMVGDFEQFLSLPGCTNGKHRFTETPRDTAVLECRHDWYQMGANVVLNIYAKGVVKEKVHILFEEKRVYVQLAFKDGQSYSKDFNLSGCIQAENSKYEVLSTKVEIKMPKAVGVSWQTLEA